jgi:hypothetical protein
MNTLEMRVELLRLAQRNDLTSAEIIGRAKEFEAYVLETGSAEEETPPRRRRGKPITGSDEPSSEL